MNNGLSIKQTKIIQDVLSNEPLVEKAVVFGSRATGAWKETSDIDLAIFGEIGEKNIDQIKFILNEEALIPLFFDVLNFHEIQNLGLKKEITEKGITIYERI